MPQASTARVYGVDHSPWVQAVLSAFYHRGVQVRLVSRPSSIASYLRKGLVMPVCRWPDGEETVDSFAIMRELDRRYPTDGGAPVAAEGQQEDLERLFLSYALGRAGGPKSWAFLRSWAEMPSGEDASTASSVRALMSLYFLILITAGRAVARVRDVDPDNPRYFRKLLGTWSKQIGSGFLGGAGPGPVDFALYGHIQCMLTGLTDDLIPILKQDAVMTEWIERMQSSLPGYPFDFTYRLEAPSRFPPRSSRADKALFYGTLGAAALAFPVTGMVLTDAFLRRQFNPARSQYPGSRVR